MGPQIVTVLIIIHDAANTREYQVVVIVEAPLMRMGMLMYAHVRSCMLRYTFDQRGCEGSLLLLCCCCLLVRLVLHASLSLVTQRPIIVLASLSRGGFVSCGSFVVVVMYSYVVTAQKATAVTHSVTGNFTSSTDINLIIAYVHRARVRWAVPDGDRES